MGCDFEGSYVEVYLKDADEMVKVSGLCVGEMHAGIFIQQEESSTGATFVPFASMDYAFVE